MTTSDTRSAAPYRTCIGCRQSRPQAELVRCAVGPQGARVGRRAAGRGAWLCSMACFHTALRRNAFERSWKCSVPQDALRDLGDSVAVALAEVHTTDTHMTEAGMRESSIVGVAPGAPTSRKG
ncbi:MAG: YlxR family protein [Actinobacteria bacterium]|nr:YlxR family protein [Actinomycetota bacterium]